MKHLGIKRENYIGCGLLSRVKPQYEEIARSTKEEFKHLVTEAFVGWLITDGYGAYRHHKRRSWCLAHLMSKAIGIAESINSRTARIGTLILEDLRDFIRAISEGNTQKQERRNYSLASRNLSSSQESKPSKTPSSGLRNFK